MTQPALFRFLPLSRLRVALAGLVFLAFAVSIAILSVDVLKQIRNESESRSNNAQWALSQIEVELIHMLLAIDAARDGSGTLDKVRLRFDVLYSRLHTLRVGSVFGGLREQPEYQDSIHRLLNFVEAKLPLIDGADEILRAGLPKLDLEASRMIADARVIALTGVEVIAKASDEDRRAVARTLTLTAVLTSVLVASLVALVIALLRLFRHNRQRAAENLATLSRLDAIVATALEAIITVDSHGRIVDFNEAASLTLGYARAEAVGADMARLQAVQQTGHLLFREGAPPNLQGDSKVRVTARHRDGRLFPAEMSISQTGEGDGALYVAFLRDLSVQLAAERALISARDEARAGEKAKADLLVVMSHEIRTPLNGMIGTIELMETTDLAPHQREYLRIMQMSGQLLMHHVNDVLDIARLDSGKAPFILAPVDLTALVREVVANQRPASQSNGNEMRFVGPSDGRNTVKCDRALLQQILLNLVGNAGKFTRNGQILIAVTHLSETGPTEILISDTGIGIPKADLGRIFDDFVTLDATYARRSSGTGLGLGIVRRIVDQMGGTLKVESEEGKGSKFWITLPLEISEAPQPLAAPEPAAPAPGTRPGQVLVVEDNEFNRVIVRAMLIKEGLEVFEARDGEEGIRLANSRRFDLILMDISMPRVDGLQATQAILTGSGPSCDSPIVAMTAHALVAEASRFRTAGMNRVLVKPITRDMLRSVLAALPDAEASDGAGPARRRLVDPAVLHALDADLGGDKARDLVRRFLTETAAQVDRIAANLLVSKPDPDMMRDLHRIAGSAAMFGAQVLESHLSEIETAWKQGQTADSAVRLAALKSIWQNTEKAFQESGALAQPSSLRYSVEGDSSSTRAAFGTDPP